MRNQRDRTARRVVILLALLLPAGSIAAQHRLSASADVGIEAGQGRGGDYDPVSHVGLAAIGQHVALSRYRGDRLTIRPLTFAVRVR